MPKLDGAIQYTMALAAAGKAVTPVGAPAPDPMATGTSLLVTVPRLIESLRDHVKRELEAGGKREKYERDVRASAGEHFLRRWWRFRAMRRKFGWRFWAIVSGGAALPAAAEQFWDRLGYAVIQGYGLTETTSLVSLNHPFRLGKGSIGKLVADDTLYNHINDTVAKLDSMATQLDEGKGTIGKLLKDETLANNLNQSVANADQLLADINAGKGGLGMIAKDPQFAAKLRDTVDKLDSLLNRVDSGQGTIGQLVVNPSLYNNLDQSLTETRGLVAAIRENPKKYLTFHVKIF